MPWTTSILYLLEWKPLLYCIWISLELISLLLFMISRPSLCSWTAFELSEFISPISVLDLQPQKEVLASSLIASHCSFPCCVGLPDSFLAIASLQHRTRTVNRRIHNTVAMVFSMRHTVGLPWFVHVQLRTKRHALLSLSKLSSVSTTRLARHGLSPFVLASTVSQVHSIAQRVAPLCSVDPETSSSESYTSCVGFLKPHRSWKSWKSPLILFSLDHCSRTTTIDGGASVREWVMGCGRNRTRWARIPWDRDQETAKTGNRRYFS